MFVEREKKPISFTKLNILPTCKSLKKLLQPIYIREQAKFKTSIHHSQKELSLITDSNFVIKQHKPIANPFNEYASHSIKKKPKLTIVKNCIQSLSPFKKISVHCRKINRRVNMTQVKNVCDKTFHVTRKNSITGWN